MGNDYGYEVKMQMKKVNSPKGGRKKSENGQKEISKKFTSPSNKPISRVRTERQQKSSKMSRTKHSESDYFGVYSSEMYTKTEGPDPIRSPKRNNPSKRKKSTSTPKSRKLSKRKWATSHHPTE